MSKTSIAAILAAAGIFFYGTDSADAQALARALQSGNQSAITDFLKAFPESPYVSDVIISIVRNQREAASRIRSEARDQIRSSIREVRQPGYRG
jgi:hypothetical protein